MRKLSRTLLCVSIAIVAAVSCASTGGIQPPARPPATGQGAVTPPDLARTRINRIVVNKDCTATIDDYKMIGKIGKKVAWLVEDYGCSPEKKWRIELQFERDWNHGQDRIIKIAPDDVKDIRINQNTQPTEGKPLEYKVYLVYPKFFGDDTRVAVIDPELEIER